MSAAKKLLVVFGATGNQGGSVIKSILADPKAASQFSLRGITRDVSKPSSQALAKQGVEVVSVSQIPSSHCSHFMARTWKDELRDRDTNQIKRPIWTTKRPSPPPSKAHMPSSQ